MGGGQGRRVVYCRLWLLEAPFFQGLLKFPCCSWGSQCAFPWPNKVLLLRDHCCPWSPFPFCWLHFSASLASLRERWKSALEGHSHSSVIGTWFAHIPALFQGRQNLCMSQHFRLRSWLVWPASATASDNFPMHSAIIGQVSLAVWIGRWLSLISWSLRCVMATAALEVVRCMLLRQTSPFLTCGLIAWKTSWFVHGTSRTEQFSRMLYSANFTLSWSSSNFLPKSFFNMSATLSATGGPRCLAESKADPTLNHIKCYWLLPLLLLLHLPLLQ